VVEDIDARSRREDRKHARALDYEGRAWQAKNDALRRLISGCRYVKHWARVAQQPTDDEASILGWRAILIRSLPG
jgi:hypothetical protein